MNGWKRASGSLKSRAQMSNYIRSLRCPSDSVLTIWRLARIMELRGIEVMGVYAELRRMQHGHLNNEVLTEMRRRADEREQVARDAPPVVAEMLPDGSLRFGDGLTYDTPRVA